jgi:predicted peroxiredoxin
MNIKNLIVAFLFLSLFPAFAFAQNTIKDTAMKKAKMLVHITQGPENPTRAALGFLVAKTAIEEGHTVNLFLAGDAVKLLQDSVLNTLSGLGTGKLSEHYDAIVKGNGKFYLSGNSSKARGVTDADIKGKPAEFALPNVLVNLSIESDKMFTY